MADNPIIITDKQYAIYVEDTIKLVSSMVIKSNAVIETMNRYLVNVFGDKYFNKADPKSWRYYKHITGEYHAVDKEMYVTSLDTFEEILFSKANLKIHKATAKGYSYGTRYYSDIISRFPAQELLIKGIINPVDYATALKAVDGEIIGYQTNLVELNEYSLIINIQTWLNAYWLRWYNGQYSISDSLYLTTFLGIMYVQLVPAIIALRLEACKTNEAHSYHYTSYLVSRGLKAESVNYLTVKQALWLYRNIEYILRNSGKTHIFELLIKHLLSERNIPIAEFSMRHDTEMLLDTLYSEPLFRKKPLNLGFAANTRELITLELIHHKEKLLNKGNEEYIIETENNTYREMQQSKSNVIMTKVLESTMIDDSNNTPVTLDDTLLSMWIYLSSIGYYKSIISVANPVSGDFISLNAKEAFCLYWYAYWKSNGITYNEIPYFLARHAPVKNVLSLADLKTVIDPKVISEDELHTLIDLSVEIKPIVSVEAFFYLANDVQQSYLKYRKITATVNHMVKRGMMEMLSYRFFSDNVCQLAEKDQTYSDWLVERTISLDGFKTIDYGNLAATILREATGGSLKNTKSLKDLQASMLNLMTYLSSYSIQIVKEINESRVIALDWPATRPGDISGYGDSLIYVDDGGVRVIDSKGLGYSHVDIDPGHVIEVSKLTGLGVNSHHILLKQLVNTASQDDSAVRIAVQASAIRVKSIVPDFNYGRHAAIPGMMEYMLSDKTLKVKDVWNTLSY